MDSMWEFVLSPWGGVCGFVFLMFLVWFFCDFSPKEIDKANKAQQRRDKIKKLFGRK